MAQIDKLFSKLKGGTGSGNFGHSGRPGKRGGSSPKGGGGPSSALPATTNLNTPSGKILKNYMPGKTRVSLKPKTSDPKERLLIFDVRSARERFSDAKRHARAPKATRFDREQVTKRASDVADAEIALLEFRAENGA